MSNKSVCVATEESEWMHVRRWKTERLGVGIGVGKGAERGLCGGGVRRRKDEPCLDLRPSSTQFFL